MGGVSSPANKLGSQIPRGGRPAEVLISGDTCELGAVWKLAPAESIESFTREMGVQRGGSKLPEESWRA